MGTSGTKAHWQIGKRSFSIGFALRSLAERHVAGSRLGA